MGASRIAGELGHHRSLHLDMTTGTVYLDGTEDVDEGVALEQQQVAAEQGHEEVLHAQSIPASPACEL